MAVAVSVEDTVSVGLLLVVQDVGVHRGDEGGREGEPPQRGVQPTPGGHVAPLAPRHHMEQQHSLVSLWKTNARLTAASISYGDIIWNMGRETSDSLSLIRHWLKKKRRLMLIPHMKLFNQSTGSLDTMATVQGTVASTQPVRTISPVKISAKK